MRESWSGFRKNSGRRFGAVDSVVDFVGGVGLLAS